MFKYYDTIYPLLKENSYNAIWAAPIATIAGNIPPFPLQENKWQSFLYIINCFFYLWNSTITNQIPLACYNVLGITPCSKKSFYQEMEMTNRVIYWPFQIILAPNERRSSDTLLCTLKFCWSNSKVMELYYNLHTSIDLDITAI